MVRFLNLLAAAALACALILGAGAAASADSSVCTPARSEAGLCDTSGSSDGSGVIVTGSQSSGDPGDPGAPGSGVGGGAALTPEQILAIFNSLCAGIGDCSDLRGPGVLNPLLLPGTPGAPGAPGAPAQTVTAADVARFLPAVGALHAEPDGWAVVGVPANFWADVHAITVDGALLGGPAQVRFTPQLYRWIYSDGAERATAAPGSSWAALGQDELTTTPTSHIYTDRAKRQASVQVIYSAEYRVGAGPWLPVVGAVTGSTPPRSMLVVTERTVLTPPA
jgi:hypothetical protein